jgi:hypothetical protein
MEDGPLQKERDKTFLTGTPAKGFPFLFADPSIEEFLFGYDFAHEVDIAWEEHEKSPIWSSL